MWYIDWVNWWVKNVCFFLVVVVVSILVYFISRLRGIWCGDIRVRNCLNVVWIVVCLIVYVIKKEGKFFNNEGVKMNVIKIGIGGFVGVGKIMLVEWLMCVLEG